MAKETDRNIIVNKSKRIVLKIGSGVIAGNKLGELDEDKFRYIAGWVSQLKDSGKEVALVTSGAIVTGLNRISLKKRPVSIPEKQAIAAVGQSSLMSLYKMAFIRRGLRVAQILLTQDDLADRKRFLNARNTVLTLFDYGVIPVINENDTVAVDELMFGDNDNLAASVTSLVEADLLIMLTDTEGLYDGDPKRLKSPKLIPLVTDIDDAVMSYAGRSGGFCGTGGMLSKIRAAAKAARLGVPTIIANGRVNNAVGRVMNENAGTLFLPMKNRISGKRHWIAFSARPGGKIVVDTGAVDALVRKGKSLLPSGIIEVDGNFDTGEVVCCHDERGNEFARGLTNYSSDDIKKIKGMKTEAIENILGYHYYDEVLHRDNLVIM